MKKKIVGIFALIILLTGILGGCTSSDGLKLSRAIIKSFDIKSFENESEISLKINAKGVKLEEAERQYIDMINNSNIVINSKQDSDKNKSSINADINIEDITYKGKMYTNGQKIWVKLPVEKKYIEYNSLELAQEDKKEEYEKAQAQTQDLVKKINPLLKDFIVNYIEEYKFAFSNLQNKGKISIETPEGSKDVTLYKVSLDYDEIENLLKYTYETYGKMLKDDSLKKLLLSIVKITAPNNPQILEGKTIKEFELELNERFEKYKQEYTEVGKEQIESQIEQIIKIIRQVYEIGPKGITITYGIDDDNHIVKNDLTIDLLLKDNGVIYSEGESDPIVDVILNIKSLNYNINNTNVTIPTISKSSSISAKEFLQTSPYVPEQFRPIKPRKRIRLQIGESEAFSDLGVKTLDAAPFIKDETTMVPVRFVGESLGASLEWRDEDRAIIYRDGDKNIIMYIDKKVAYINGNEVYLPTEPVIKNGRAMVPLRFISEELGATVTWNGELKMITIEK